MPTLAVQPSQYIYPPRAKMCCPYPSQAVDTLKEFGWQAQYKFNDSRCLIKYIPGWHNDPHLIQLWNRHGERFRDYTAPLSLLEELAIIPSKLNLSNDGYHLLDSGLLDKKHQAIKDTIVIWDILVADGDHQLGTTYNTRYQQLSRCANHGDRNFLAGNHILHVGNNLTENVFTPITITNWDAAWQALNELNLAYPPNSPLIEGLFYKDYAGKLEPGYNEKNNHSWQARSRVQTGRHHF